MISPLIRSEASSARPSLVLCLQPRHGLLKRRGQQCGLRSGAAFVVLGVGGGGREAKERERQDGDECRDERGEAEERVCRRAQVH